MAQDILLLADANIQRRSALRESLAHRFQAVVASSPEQARTLFARHQPKVAVLALIQPSGNGLELGRSLRGLPGGPGAFIVVHGNLAGLGSGATTRQQAQRAHQVDAWFPTLPEPALLDSILNEELRRRAVQVRAQAAQGARPGPVLSAREQEESWRELLQSEATAGNLKALLTKEIPLGRKPGTEGPEPVDGPPSARAPGGLRDLLTRDITLEDLRGLFRK